MLVVETLAVAVFVTAQFGGGTQPNELVIGPAPSNGCNCHDDFRDPNVRRPGQSYRASMMANAARDPLFRAAFVIARDDRPDLSELCLRCHAPTGWLYGRSEGDLDELTTDDLESVTCDICHRMVPADPPLVGDGQYTISRRAAKRSRRGTPSSGGHEVLRSDYTGSAEACAICHSLFNPAEQGYDANALPYGDVYYEQRTYEEWLDSDFSQPGGETCIDCHMERAVGTAVRDGQTLDDLYVHSFSGGNIFALEGVALLNRSLFSPEGFELQAARRWAQETLERAARLEITSPTSSELTLASGEAFSLDVRLTNLTGHKLPSGYPEGRRVYLEVSIELDGQTPEVVSGRWNPETGTVVPDPQLRTYETEHGRVENGIGRRERSLILMNQIISDTRIPPRGFVPDATRPDMHPEGRDYGSPPYNHWDDHRYDLTAPEVTTMTSGQVVIRALHQTTDGDVVSFLLAGAAGTMEATNLAAVWEALDHAPPDEMVRISLPITVMPPTSEPDAGTSSSRDAGVSAPDAGSVSASGGCACAGSQPSSNAAGFALLVLATTLVLRRRRR